MVKVVLDANQYVSALLKPGSKPDKIFRLLYAGHIRLLISPRIVREIKRVLLYKKVRKYHNRTPKQVGKFLEGLIRVAEVTPGRLRLEVVKDDPTDDKYLECALEGQADFIISGDHHLTDLRSFRGVRIVDPSTFLRLIEYEDLPEEPP